MDRPVIRDHATEFADADEAMRLEDSVWWWVGRRAILRTFLDRARRETPLSRIIEIGCGSGGDLGLLAEYGEVIGVERSEGLAKRARSRGAAAEVRTGDFFDLPLAGSAQMICLFDVLEHIEDDDGFLARLGRTAAPSHLLLLSVPACPALFGPHDRLLHHYRRYSRRRLEELLRRNGYTTLKGSYYLFFLFPLAAVSRLTERVRARLGRPLDAVELGVVPPWANRLLTALLKLEAAVARAMPLPIGVWFIVLARRGPTR